MSFKMSSIKAITTSVAALTITTNAIAEVQFSTSPEALTPASIDSMAFEKEGSARKFGFKFGMERSGTSIMDLFNDEEPGGVSPYIQATYGNKFGLEFTGRASVNLWHDSLDDFAMDPSDIGIPVRSDIRAYRQDAVTLDRLFASYSFNPGGNFYGRVTAGLLQTQFSGAQLELLYAPSDSPFAIGAEIAQVQKRDPDDMFETLDYEVTTGHVTAYYDTGYPGILLSASYGTYLAEDEGATITAAKRFQNGWEVRGELTATEYYFDAEDDAEDYLVPKLTLYIPLSLIGRDGRYGFSKLVSSDTDAGRKLEISEGLYGDIRGYQATGYSARWGGF